MDVARLNFSHGDHDSHRQMFKWVREAARELDRSVAIMQDIQGPKLRVGRFPGGSIELSQDMETRLVPDGGMGDHTTIPVGYEALIEDVDVGHRVLLADGLVALEVIDKTDTGVLARCVNGGVLKDQKGVAFPDSSLSAQNVTSKDRADLELGRELGVEYVAASFVRTAADVEAVTNVAGDVPIIAKIELAQALDNLDEILAASFGVMVARGIWESSFRSTGYR